MNHKMQNNTPESDEENVLIWRIQFDHSMFRLRKNEIDFMTVENLYAFWSILFCDSSFQKDVDIFFKAWQ